MNFGHLLGCNTIAFNIQKMDRFGYEASFFDLRSQMTNASDKCRLLSPIRKVFRLQNTTGPQ